MITRSGWMVAALGIVAASLGRFASIDELTVLGLAGPAVLIVSTLWVLLLRLRLSVTRSIQPMRAHVGGSATATLSVSSGRGRCPVVEVTDTVTGTSGVTFRTGPFNRSEATHLTYQLPTASRGRLAIGPAQLTVTDPLGLASTSLVGGEAGEFVVYPKVVELAPVAFTPGGRTRQGVSETHSVRRLGEDFYALRDYTPGDDPRRIHWPSTARLGRPMVREDETPRVHRVALLLDTRAAAYGYDDDRFEVAVTAVASVAAACARRQDTLQLVSTNGDVITAGASQGALVSMFDFLADVAPTERGNLRQGVAQLATTDASAMVAVVGGNDVNQDAQLELTASLVGVDTSVTVVRIGADGPPEMVRRGHFKLVGVSAVDQLSGVWNAAQQSRGTAPASGASALSGSPRGTNGGKTPLGDPTGGSLGPLAEQLLT